MLRDAMLTASWQAAALTVVVCAITLLGGRWIPPRWRCVLWSLVFLRLVMPALPPSPLSVFNFRAAATMTTPTPVAAPLKSVDDAEVVTFGVVPDATPPVVPGPTPPSSATGALLQTASRTRATPSKPSAPSAPMSCPTEPRQSRTMHSTLSLQRRSA